MYKQLVVLICLITVVANAATYYQFPLWVGVDDNDGNQLSSGEVTVYAHGTTTLSTLYDDKDGSSAITNPHAFNAYGRTEIYAAMGYYDIVLTNSAGVTQEAFDGGFRIGPSSDFGSTDLEIITLTAGNATGGGVQFDSPTTDDYLVWVDVTNGGLTISNTSDSLDELIFTGDGNALFADGKEVLGDEFRARDADGVRVYDDSNNGLYVADGGAASFSHALTVTGALTQTGAAALGSTLTVTGAVTLDSTLSIAGVLTANGGSVFNEASADKDFRIESNGDANMFFVDGGNDNIGIGTATPDSDTLVHVYGGTSGTTFTAIGYEMIIEDNASAVLGLSGALGSTIFFSDSTSPLKATVSSRPNIPFLIQINGGGIDAFRALTTEIIINDGSDDCNFRVESDTDPNCLFVDAGNSRIGIGTATPGYSLEVNGTVYATAIASGAYAFSSTATTQTEHAPFTANGSSKIIAGDTLADEGSDDILKATGQAWYRYGYGFVFCGGEYAYFSFEDGAVTLVSNSANVVNTDTDTNFCIIGTNRGAFSTKIQFKNRLGASYNYAYEITWFDG